MLTGIARQREVCQQLKAAIEIAEPQERHSIREMFLRQQLRLFLMLIEAQIEIDALDGPYDPKASRKLDAIRVLLEK